MSKKDFLAAAKKVVKTHEREERAYAAEVAAREKEQAAERQLEDAFARDFCTKRDRILQQSLMPTLDIIASITRNGAPAFKVEVVDKRSFKIRFTDITITKEYQAKDDPGAGPIQFHLAVSQEDRLSSNVLLSQHYGAFEHGCGTKLTPKEATIQLAQWVGRYEPEGLAAQVAKHAPKTRKPKR